MWVLLIPLGVLAAIAIAASDCAAACGFRGEEPQTVAIADTGELQPGSPSQPGTGTDTSTAPGGPTAPVAGGPAGPAPTDPSGGTGSGAADDGAGAQAAAAGCGGSGEATDVGVTADTIALGNVSQLGGVIQGFGQTAVAGTQAYVNYRNSLGGVCGRLLELKVEDDRFSTGDNRQGYLNLIDEVFAFVGSLSVVDDGGVSVLEGTNVPDVTLSLSDAKLGLANNFSPIPIDPNDGGQNSDVWARWLKENEGVESFALVWAAQASSRNGANRYRTDYLRAGLTEAYSNEVAVTETNYTPHAVRIAEQEVDLVTTALEVQGMSQLAIELDKQGYQPTVAQYGAQAYGPEFVKRSGAAANGVRIVLTHDIVEGSANPLTQQLAAWYERTNPGLGLDFFAVVSWIASHMLAESMEAVGRDLTRDRVLAELNGLRDWDSDGMLAPISPGPRIGPQCFLIAEVVDGSWQRSVPSEGFICP